MLRQIIKYINKFSKGTPEKTVTHTVQLPVGGQQQTSFKHDEHSEVEKISYQNRIEDEKRKKNNQDTSSASSDDFSDLTNPKNPYSPFHPANFHNSGKSTVHSNDWNHSNPKALHKDDDNEPPTTPPTSSLSNDRDDAEDNDNNDDDADSYDVDVDFSGLPLLYYGNSIFNKPVQKTLSIEVQIQSALKLV